MSKKKQNTPKPPASGTPPKLSNPVYAQGFSEGFTAGLKSNFDLASAQRIGFEDGVRHIVTLAEDFLVKALELPSRDALAKSNKIPIWWMATLVTSFCETKPESEPSTIREPKIKGE